MDSGELSKSAAWCYQWSLLTKRSFSNIMRLPAAFKVKIFVTIVVALIMDIIYAGTNPQLYSGVDNINGALFFATMVMGFSAV